MRQPVDEGPRSALVRRLVWALLCVAAVVPFLVAAFPPLYDYYHWVFEGHLFASLAFGGTPQDEAIAEAYGIAHLPVPNMAATIVMGLLNVCLPPLVAGRVFTASCALLFAAGFSYMARSLQGRPTVLGVLGFPWAFGFFLYKGYLSYVFSVAVAFFAIGLLHRKTGGGVRAPGWSGSIALGALAVLLFLSHLVGWVVFVGVAGLYALSLLRSDRRTAVRMLLPVLPSFVLPAWYAAGAGGDRSILYYHSWSDKLRSLVEPWFLYLQTDPVPPPFPTVWLSVGGLVILAGLLFASRDRGPERRIARPLLALAALLVLVALVLPFNNFKGMNRPDGRLVFPALLIAAAALPFRRETARAQVLVGGLVLAGVGLHAFEYHRASRFLEKIEATLEETTPRDEPGLSVAIILPGPDSGCRGGPFSLPIGRTDTLRWFGLVPMLEAEGVRVSLMATSVVEKYFGHDELRDLKSVALEPWNMVELARSSRSYAAQYSYAEIFGCPNDVARASAALSPYFDEVATGHGFAVLVPVDLPEPASPAP